MEELQEIIKYQAPAYMIVKHYQDYQDGISGLFLHCICISGRDKNDPKCIGSVWEVYCECMGSVW